MEIKNYDQAYERQVVDLWNKCMVADCISVNTFRRQVLFDENFQRDLCFLAFEDEKVVGFLLATKRLFPYHEFGLEENRGWINVMFVEEEYRNKGIGTALIQKAESILKQKGVQEITLGAYIPNYFFPGVDINAYKEAVTLFEKLGYECFEPAESMNGSLINYQLPEDFNQKLKEANEKGYKFQKFDYKYSFKLLDFLLEQFGADWKFNALKKMEAGIAQDYIWICIDSSDDVVGYCMRAIDGSEGRFGPFGVKDSLRSQGLGNILFCLMMEDMKQRRIYNVYFLWTHEALAFYQRHGIHIYRYYNCYKKQI